MKTSLFQRYEKMSTPECSHFLLSPRWEDAEDIGTMNKASQFVCETCGRLLTPATRVHDDDDKEMQSVLRRLRLLVSRRLRPVAWQEPTEPLHVHRALLRQSGPRVCFVSGASDATVTDQGHHKEQGLSDLPDDQAATVTSLDPAPSSWQSGLSGSPRT